MPRPRHVLVAMILCAAATLIVGAGATASVAPGTLANIVSPADVGAPAAPAECAGMTFQRTIIGTPRNDLIHATDVPTMVFGLGGNDVIVGGEGRDCLVGGDGADVIDGGGDDDVIVGGDGNDRLAGGASSDRIYGGPGNDRLFDAGLGPDGDGDRAMVDRSWRVRIGVARRDRGDTASSDSSPDLLDGGIQRDRCSGSPLDTFVDCEQVLERQLDPALVIQPDDVIGTPVDPDRTAPPGVPRAPAPTDRIVPTEPPIDPTPPSTTVPDPTPIPIPTPEATLAPTPDPTPEPTPAPTPDPTPKPTPAPTAEPTPDPTPEPTPEPTPTG